MDKRQKLILGNWKMNQSLSEIESFFSNLSGAESFNCQWGIAPQSIHIPKLVEKKSILKNLLVGSQNCSENNNGAFTGELSVDSLIESGVDFTLVGHSERRSLYGETNSIINKKVIHALNKNLRVIFCLGETLEERENEKTFEVLREQLTIGLAGLPESASKLLVIAYEPVWAIGTGKTATSDQAQEAHHFIRKCISEIKNINHAACQILYGGSVKPENIQELLANEDIDGALVGGASLKGDSFTKLCNFATTI